MIARTAGIAPARAVVATALPALGVALIWIFVVVFVVYPLLRVFYDAFSDESGCLTLQNFVAFAVDALSRIDPSLEEAAESVGARGWRKLATITLPLTTPGYVAGALLVFIWTFSDFATPLVLGVHDLLASQAYLNIVQFVDRRLFRMGLVISALMVALAVLFLVAARRYVAIKDYSSLSYSKVARRRLGRLGATAAVTFLSAVLAFSFVPYLGVALASVGKGWSMTPFPVRYTWLFFERVIVETPKYIVNSFL